MSMDRAKYSSCVGEFMRSVKPKDQEERKLLFCSAAKICSQKAKTKEEAMKLCLEAPPKEAGEAKPSRRAGPDREKKRLYRAFMQTADLCDCGELQRLAQELMK